MTSTPGRVRTKRYWRRPPSRRPVGKNANQAVAAAAAGAVRRHGGRRLALGAKLRAHLATNRVGTDSGVVVNKTEAKHAAWAGHAGGNHPRRRRLRADAEAIERAIQRG